MKTLLLSTAILAAAGSAIAQDVEIFRSEADPLEIRASDLTGMRIYASEAAIETDEYEGAQEGWEDVGEVNDVILSREGDVQAVLVDIGGFLGIGERQVAVSMDALRFVSDSATAEDVGDYFLVMNASRANLEEAPEYVAGEMAAEDAATETGDAIGDAGAATAAAGAAAGAAAVTAADAVTDEATEVGEEVGESNTAAAATEAATETEMEAEDTAAAATGEATTDETAATDDGTTTTVIATETTETTEATTEGVATTDEAATVTTETEVADTAAGDAASGDTATEDVATEDVATEEVAAEDIAGGIEGRTPITREGFVAAGTEALTADTLQGAAVYDANDERVGEVSELLMTEDGQVTDVVVDVGGFLGIGEKPVAMQLGSIDILQQEGGEEIRVYLSDTKEQLEALPTYEN